MVRKLCLLVFWILGLMATLWIAVDETGRNEICTFSLSGDVAVSVAVVHLMFPSADVNAFRQQMDVGILEENWGTTYEQVMLSHEQPEKGWLEVVVVTVCFFRPQVFSDIQNYEDMWTWFKSAFRNSLYADTDSPRLFRTGTNVKSSWSQGGSLHGFNFWLGRPRLRQIRSNTCSFSLSRELDESPLHNATCFRYMGSAWCARVRWLCEDNVLALLLTVGMRTWTTRQRIHGPQATTRKHEQRSMSNCGRALMLQLLFCTGVCFSWNYEALDTPGFSCVPGLLPLSLFICVDQCGAVQGVHDAL